MTDDFSYINARVRARRGRLLPEGFFSEALTLGFAELVHVLGEAGYGEDLAKETGPEATGEDLSRVDRAVLAHLDRNVHRLVSIASGDAREAIALIMMRADLENVRAILRRKRAGQAAGDIRAQLVGGTLPRGVLDLALDAPDAASVAQALTLSRHPLAGALRDAVALTRDEPGALEPTMTRLFLERILHQARGLAQRTLFDYLALEIDAANLRAAFQIEATEMDGDPRRLFVAGGHHVSYELFARVAAGELAAMDELSRTPLRDLAEVRDPATLERKLRCVLLAKAREGGTDALGAGLVLDYVRRAEWEASRIRLLARRAYYGLAPEAVQRDVVCP